MGRTHYPWKDDPHCVIIEEQSIVLIDQDQSWLSQIINERVDEIIKESLWTNSSLFPDDGNIKHDEH